VTDFLKLKHAGYRPQIFVSATVEERRMIGGGHYCNHPARADATVMIRGPLQTRPDSRLGD
jgi:hypothetical protein